MIFILLTFLAAFAIEGLGTYVSVIGLSTLFGANPVIIALAIALDAGKLVVVTLLYSYWKQLGKVMKAYALVAAAITMIITSAGASGYLSGEFQKAIMGTQEGSLKVDVLKGQIAKYEERKKQIDAQIAALPEKTTVNQRLRLMNAFKAEQTDLQAKINDIDKQLPELQIKQISVEAKAGPILYVAKAFDIPVESAVKWVILMIIFVFDPLAVFLIVAGNFLLHQHRTKKEHKLSDADLFAEKIEKFDPVKHGGEFPAGIDEPGFGNSAVRFDEQIKAMPPELRVAPPDDVAPVLKVHDPVDDWVENHPKYTGELGISWPLVPPAPAVVEPTSPIFEVLQPTPSDTDDGAGVKTFDDTHVHVSRLPDEHEDDGAGVKTHEPEVLLMKGVEEEDDPDPEPIEPPAPTPSVVPRDLITLEQLRPSTPRSMLNDIVADNTVTFEDSPHADIARRSYQSLANNLK